MLDIRIWLSGKKNKAMPMPCHKRGNDNCQKLACSLSFDTQSIPALKIKKAVEAAMRKFKRCEFWPTMGARTTAKIPIGAIASPAQVAV